MFNNYQKRGINWFFVIFYLVLGIYFLNHPIQFVKIPEFVLGFNNWIIFIGGVFMIIGAINSIRMGIGYR